MTIHEECRVCHKLGHRKDMYQQFWHDHVGYGAPDVSGYHYYHPKCFKDDKFHLIYWQDHWMCIPNETGST